jgi:hypothetical protein
MLHGPPISSSATLLFLQIEYITKILTFFFSVYCPHFENKNVGLQDHYAVIYLFPCCPICSKDYTSLSNHLLNSSLESKNLSYTNISYNLIIVINKIKLSFNVYVSLIYTIYIFLRLYTRTHNTLFYNILLHKILWAYDLSVIIQSWYTIVITC